MVIDSINQSRAFFFSSPSQQNQQQQQQQKTPSPLTISLNQPIPRPHDDVDRDNAIAETILLSGSLNQINLLNQPGSPPVILSPPPLPDRQPTMEKIWNTQSPRRTPTASPRGSPFGSPRVSPCHTPAGSPSTLRKQHSPEEIPSLPKPYTGNSSLLRKNEDNCGITVEMGNIQLPPLPARNKRQSRPLSLKSRSNAASPVLSTATNCSYNPSEKKATEHSKATLQHSFHRRTHSDDQLNRSWDASDFEEPPVLQRSFSVTKSKPKLYEPIFNSSSNFLFSAQFGGSSDHHDKSKLNEEEFQKMAIVNRNKQGSIKKLDLNRPVPLPPFDDNDGDSEMDQAPLQRPTTLSVIAGSRPGSASDSDAPTPSLPPKKNKIVAPALVSPEEVVFDSIATKVVEPSGEMEDESPTVDVPPCENVFVVKEAIDQEKEIVNIEDEKMNDDANGEDDDDNSSTCSDPTMHRKKSQVYYPIPSNNFSRDVIACHDFYDEDDDAPWKNYDAPVPIINTPTSEMQPKWSPVSSDEPNTPSTEFAKYTGTNDPFLNDSFFKRKGENEGAETPPPPPTRSTSGVVPLNNQGVDETTRTSSEHSDNIQNTEASPAPLLVSQNSVEGDSPQPPPTSTRSGRHDTPMKFYEQDFEVLMRQGYAYGDIRRALTVANNNFSIARAILKEFTQNKP